MNRRTVLLAAVGASLGLRAVAARAPHDVSVIDSHIHLWDPKRPQGSPFDPYKGIGMTATEYARWRPDGVVGAIAVDASPWIEDNLWLLEDCAKDSIMVGAVGNLKPEAKEFPEYLERYHRNPLYLGFRYGNIWNYDIVAQAKTPVFMQGLRLVAQAGLVLDVGNPEIGLLETIVRISDAIPELCIVAEHLAAYKAGPATTARYNAVLREFQQRPRIYGKISSFGDLSGEVENPPFVSKELSHYQDRLDQLTETFGEDRVIAGVFGSREVNFGGFGNLEIVQQYYAGKSREAAEKFFWKNSLKAYKWVHRRPDQPKLA